MTLIGATTENPYFEVNSALLSRSQIYELRALEPAAGRASCSSGRSPTPSAGSPTRPRSPTRRSSCSPSAPAATRGRRSAALERAVETARATGGDGRPRRRPRTRCSARRSLYDKRGRPPLRLRLGLIKATRGSDPDAVALLPGGDARGRRGPALHRPADGDPRLRGHRQRRPAGAGRRDRRRRRRSTGSGCPSARSTSPRRPPTWRWRRSRTRSYDGDLRAPPATSASTAPSCRPTTCATPTTRARRSSAAARATSTRTTSPAASPTSRCCPRRSEGERFYEPTDRGFEAELARAARASSASGAATEPLAQRPPPVSASGSARSRRRAGDGRSCRLPASGRSPATRITRPSRRATAQP